MPNPTPYRIELVGARARFGVGARPRAERSLVDATSHRRESELSADGREVDNLRQMLTAVSSEITAIAPCAKDGLLRAARDELDAIATGTAEAANDILAAAESIDAQARALRAHGAWRVAAAELDTIVERVTALYEACTFQDIAGQRIAKLTKTLALAEGRLARAVAAFGGELSCDRVVPGPGPNGSSLVNGPKAPGAEGHVTQADIDLMFA